MKSNRLFDLFRAGQGAVAGWMSIDSAYAAELVGASGFDAVVIDCQHGMAGHAQMLAMLQALSHTAAVPLVRVSQNNLAEINRALDAGAYGVICPMVNTREDAQNLVAWTHYAPKGTRSFSPVRAVLYSGADYAVHANETIVTFAMIETAQALDNLDSILSVEGLDAIYIGPSDLSLSLGCTPTLFFARPV